MAYSPEASPVLATGLKLIIESLDTAESPNLTPLEEPPPGVAPPSPTGTEPYTADPDASRPGSPIITEPADPAASTSDDQAPELQLPQPDPTERVNPALGDPSRPRIPKHKDAKAKRDAPDPAGPTPSSSSSSSSSSPPPGALALGPGLGAALTVFGTQSPANGGAALKAYARGQKNIMREFKAEIYDEQGPTGEWVT